ncbi:hypothetical protein WDZ92_47650, partial [Nostoc sp. NIES-2111]
QHLNNLKAEAPAKRLTMTRLLRPLGEDMVRRNLSRLPQLSALLEHSVESALAFGLRRVDQAIATLLKEGMPLQLWRIQRLTRLRQWRPAFTAHTEREIERLNAENSVRPHSLP